MRACSGMGVIQIRNVPPELHRKLKAKAAAAGLSLSDYLLRGVERQAEQLSLDEIRERVRRLPPVDPVETPAEIIRALRDAE